MSPHVFYLVMAVVISVLSGLLTAVVRWLHRND